MTLCCNTQSMATRCYKKVGGVKMLFRVYWGFEPIIYAQINATIPINCMHTTKSNLQSLNIFQDKELLVTIVFNISKGPMRRLDDNPALF